MTSRPNRHLRRELERELRDVPAATPPADLLAKIQAEIPADLRAANGDEPAQGSQRRRLFSSTGFRIAASVAVAVVGVALGYRVLSERASKPAPAQDPELQSKGALLETQPIPYGTESPARSEDERPSVKGKTKDSGDSAVSTNGARQDALAEGEAASSEGPLRIAAAPPAAPSDAERKEMEEKLASLGYLGDGVVQEAQPASPAPSSDATPREGAAKPQAPGSLSGGVVGGTLTPMTAEELAKEDRARQAWQGSGKYQARKPGTSSPTDTAASDATLRAASPRVEVTDVGAEGQSSSYYDFDAVEEMYGTRAPSTGGQREPNEQQVGDMFFRETDTNPFVDTAEDRLSTFALDVDTGSWTLTRSYLERGLLPPPDAIRVEEFVNAQRYDDPAPRHGDFTLVAEGAPSPFAPSDSYRLVRFAVKAREIDARDRKPAVLTFVVDVSGSMDRENRLGLVKRALGLLLDELGGDDRVALVVYGSQGRVLLRHTRDHEAIRSAIHGLRPDGSTNAEEGLRLGYDLAAEAWRSGAINRVILCSDGVANVGATGPESILTRIGADARRGIELTTVGFGMGNYNDALMEQLADQGNGSYHYVDSLDEARRIFVENLTGTLQTVARDAKVQVEFDPRVVDRWRLVGYENRDVADRDFRNDAVDAGEVGVGHTAVALYEVRLRPGARSGDPVGTLRLRWKSRATKQVEEAALALEVGELEEAFRRASANLRTAAVAAELAERLKRSYWAKDGSWNELLRATERLESERGQSADQLGEAVRRVARLTNGAGDPSEPPYSEPDRERRDDD